MEQRVGGLENAVFGYWEEGKRVKGLIEQTNDIITAVKKRDDDFAKAGSEAWKIARPVIGMLAVLSLVGIANLFFGPHGVDTAIKALSAAHGG